MLHTRPAAYLFVLLPVLPCIRRRQAFSVSQQGADVCRAVLLHHSTGCGCYVAFSPLYVWDILASCIFASRTCPSSLILFPHSCKLCKNGFNLLLQGATAATNSPSKTFASHMGEKAGEEARHKDTLKSPGRPELASTSAVAALRAQPLRSPVATDPTRQRLGEPRHLSSFLIRSNLAAARRAFRNMRDNEQ